MVKSVQLLVTVGLVRNCEGTNPSDDDVRNAIHKCVSDALSGYTQAPLDAVLNKALPHDASLNYMTSKVVLLPVPHDPGVAERLEHDRKDAADRFYEQFDFGDNIVADANGWDRILGQNGWRRVVFFENPNGGDSIRGEFYVTFKDKSVEIEDGDYSLGG